MINLAYSFFEGVIKGLLTLFFIALFLFSLAIVAFAIAILFL